MPGQSSDRRLALGLVTSAVLCGVAALVTLTPDDLHPVASTYEGLPRLGLYVLAATALAATGLALSSPREDILFPTPSRAEVVKRDAWLWAWLLLALAVASVNAVRLDDDIAVGSGPAAWLFSIALVGVAIFPSLRPGTGRPGTVRDWTLGWLALGAVLALAVVVRFVDLDGVPANVQADEGDRAGSALDVLDGLAPASWFDSGWFYINMMYFRLLAGVFELFGTGVVQGRSVNAAAGVLIVVAVAWIGLRHFDRRVGLAATALAATSPFALQFSRTIAESGVLAALFALSLAGLMEGFRSGRAWPFALAGLAGGLSFYTYPSARTWPIAAAGTFVVMALGSASRRVVVRGAAIVAVTATVAVLPYAVHLRQHPDEVALRFEQTSALRAENRARLPYTRPDMPVAEVVTMQVEHSFGLFDRYGDESRFLPTGRPVFPRLLAVLTLLGIFYATIRAFRDRRLAILALWFWVGLSGVVLTVDTPAAQRAAGLVVTLPLLVAVVLCEGAARIPAAVTAARRRWGTAPAGSGLGRAQLVRVADGVLAVTVIGLMFVQLGSYFVDYKRVTGPWSDTTEEGRQIAALGEHGPVYSLEQSQHRVKSGWVRFLARDARTGSIANPGAQLPLLAADERLVPKDPRREIPLPAPGETMSFVLYGADELAYLAMLRDLYPGGVTHSARDRRTVFQVSPQARARVHGVKVRAGDTVLGTVGTFGALPADTRLPALIRWSAGVRVGRTGLHRFELEGPQGTRLEVDGEEVGVTGRAGKERGVLRIASGLHFLEVEAPVSSRNDAIRLGWSARLATRSSRADLVPFDRARSYALMTRPWGLLEQDVAGAQATGMPQRSVVAGLAGGWVNVDEPPPYPGRIVWRGSLLVPRAGRYRTTILADRPAALTIDGKTLSGAASVAARDRGLFLERGLHPIEVAITRSRSGPPFARWVWIVPAPDGRANTNGSWSVVPPSLLRPADSVRVVEKR